MWAARTRDVRAFNNDVTLFRPVAEQLGWSLDDSKIVRGISRVFEFTPVTLTWITVGVIAKPGNRWHQRSKRVRTSAPSVRKPRR